MSAGGIVLTDGTVEADRHAQVRGTVVAIGEACWKDLAGRKVVTQEGSTKIIESAGAPWCKVGDRVIFQRYSGMRIPNERGKYQIDLILVNDQDITAVIEEDTDE